jgi:uncharacterized membrane protein
MPKHEPCLNISRLAGMSPLGTAASAAGGLFIGVVAWLFAAVITPQYALKSPQWPLALVGLAGGLLGSLIDSLLGAVLQRSWLETATGRVTSRLPKGSVVVDGALIAFWSPGQDTDNASPGSGSGGPRHDTHSTASSGAVRKRSGDSTRSAESTNNDGNTPGGAGAVVPVAKAGSSNSQGGTAADKPLHFVIVCGWDVLSNEAVNFASASLTGLLLAWACSSAIR